MPKKTIDERKSQLAEDAVRIGIGERYAKALASASVRHRLDGRVRRLLERFGRDYAKAIEMNREMWDDPFAFQKKYIGDRRFRRFATLSLTYSDASPVKMVLRLLGDAKHTRECDSAFRRAPDVFGPEETVLDSPDLFWGLRVGEKRAAFYADMRGNGIGGPYLDIILERIAFEKLPENPYVETPFDRMTAVASLYRFFGGPQGRGYVSRMRDEKTTEGKEALSRKMADAFFSAFRSDKSVNPDLDIGEDVWAYRPNLRRYRVLGYGEDYKPVLEPLTDEKTG
jgi:hypothetical protein